MSRYHHMAECLACGNKERVGYKSKKDYKEINVCPKCSGAFIDVWHITKYKNKKSNDNGLPKQNEAKFIKANKITFVDGGSEIVTGEVRLFYSNAVVQLTAVPGINYFNSDNVLSVTPIDNDEKVISKKNHLDGMKINETALNIRSEIVESRIEHLKDITPEQLESLVQLFEKENNRKLISDMSLQRKIDALGLAPIDSKVYNEHLKHMENIGVGVRHFKYYKLYRQTFMPYSQEYLLGNSIEHLLKRDKENNRQCCPLLFGRLKRRIDKWLLRRELRKTGKKVR